MIMEPARSSLSDKDLELVVRTYRRTSELYLENKTSSNYLNDLAALTALVPMVFVVRSSSNGPLLSQMEILRARVRQCPALLEPLEKAISHLQRPIATNLRFEELKYCLENSSLFNVGCTVAIRYYEGIASHPQFDWKTVIEHIGQNISASPALAIELLLLLCEGNEFHSKLTVKSGAIRYLFSSFIASSLKDKLNLYKAIKLLKTVSSADRSILREKERVVATVIVAHEDYIPIVADLCLKCYEGTYAGEIASRQSYETGAIDQPFVWSYAEPFCKLMSKATIENLKKMWKSANGELQAKIYAILANFSRYCKESQLQLITMLPRQQQSLLNYLKMCLSLSQIDPGSPKLLDWGYLDKLAEANPSAKVAQLAKYLKELAGKQVRVGSLSHAQKSLYNTDKNMDLMLQKASRIPKTNEQLQDLRQILSQKPSSNEFQSDNLRIAKQKAIQSLQKAITQKNPLKLNSLLSGVELNDVVLVAKILNIVELHLMMNEAAAEDIDLDRILQMIQWIERNYDGEIIDWGSIGQLLITLCEENEWVKHMKLIPELNYWILGIQYAEGKAEALVWSSVQKALTNPDTRKLSIMVGFLGKVLTPQQKETLLSKYSKLLHQMQTNLQQGRYYKLTLMMLSYFIKGWHQIEQDSPDWKKHNEKFEVLISPLVRIVLANFRSLPQEYRFLENCLPYPISSAQLLPHVDALVSTHGKLSAYLSKEQVRLGRKPQLAPERLVNIDTLPPSGIQQTLIFLQANDDMVKAAQLTKISSLTSKKDSYWQLYPNYVNIMSHLIQIVGQTDNANVKPSLTDLTVQLVNQVEDNRDLTGDEKEELLGEVKTSLESMNKRGVYIEIERVRKVVTRIIEEEIREEIIYILNNYKCKQPPPPPPPPPKPQPYQDARKYVSMKPRHELQKPVKKQMSLSLSSLDLQIPSVRQINSSASIMHIPDERGERQEFVEKEKVNVDTQLVEMRQKEPSSLLDAFEILNRIVNKQESPEKYDHIHEIFMNNNVSEQEKDLLGELLAKFYAKNANSKALTLLLDKDKTNLTKEQLYELIAENKDAFVLVRRWKVLSRQGLDIAMLRIGEGFVTDACQVAHYNLQKPADLQYFYAKKYHLIVIRHFGDVNGEDAAEYFLRLIGASARLPQIRQQYLAHSIHLKIVKLLRTYDTSRITAAFCYAMASLLFEQQESCLDVARDTNNLKFMLTSIRREKATPAVVYPASCFLANMTYSNGQVKQTLRTNNIITLLMGIFENNLSQPDIQSLKQLLRAMGNLSISKLCSEELVNSRFCECAVKMAEGLDIFIEFDEKKAKIVKLLIDLVANIATQRTGLQVMHREKITLLIITLLETTERDVAILGGCIDTVDALCQDQECENYLVAEKRLPWILIDVLKIQEDSVILLKAARLITNLTLHNSTIPYILRSNILGVIANIVLPHAYGGGVAGEQLKKLQAYAIKTLTRVHQAKPPLDTLLKSGFLECLLRVVESAAVEDSFIQLLFDYSSHLPNFLSKRGFTCLIRILTARVNSQTVLEKCIRSFKNILGFSYDREDEDIVISGIPQMYEKFLQSQYQEDALFLLGYHLLRSHQLRVVLKKREDRVFDSLTLLGKKPELQETCKSLIFLIYNPRISLWLEDFGPNSEEEFYKIMRTGFSCYLYRADGSYKAAKLDLDEQYNLRAYKQPDGEIKRKYTINIRYVKDLQLDYAHNEELWRQTAFSVERGIFDSHIPSANLCATLVGNARWGEINFINVEFVREDDKMLFYRALSQLLAVFRG